MTVGGMPRLPDGELGELGSAAATIQGRRSQRDVDVDLLRLEEELEEKSSSESREEFGR